MRYTILTYIIIAILKSEICMKGYWSLEVAEKDQGHTTLYNSIPEKYQYICSPKFGIYRVVIKDEEPKSRRSNYSFLTVDLR